MPSDKIRQKSNSDRQITVKVSTELHDRLVLACGYQEHREGQLARILIEWALPFYEKARSVERLPASDDLLDRQVAMENSVLAKARNRKQRSPDKS